VELSAGKPLKGSPKKEWSKGKNSVETRTRKETAHTTNKKTVLCHSAKKKKSILNMEEKSRKNSQTLGKSVAKMLGTGQTTASNGKTPRKSTSPRGKKKTKWEYRHNTALRLRREEKLKTHWKGRVGRERQSQKPKFDA